MLVLVSEVPLSGRGLLSKEYAAFLARLQVLGDVSRDLALRRQSRAPRGPRTYSVIH